MRFCGISLRAISKKCSRHILNKSLKITNSRLQPHLPEANELILLFMRTISILFITHQCLNKMTTVMQTIFSTIFIKQKNYISIQILCHSLSDGRFAYNVEDWAFCGTVVYIHIQYGQIRCDSNRNIKKCIAKFVQLILYGALWLMVNITIETTSNLTASEI